MVTLVQYIFIFITSYTRFCNNHGLSSLIQGSQFPIIYDPSEIRNLKLLNIYLNHLVFRGSYTHMEEVFCSSLLNKFTLVFMKR